MSDSKVVGVAVNKKDYGIEKITVDELINIRKKVKGEDFLRDCDLYFNEDCTMDKKALVSYKLFKYSDVNNLSTFLVFVDNLDWLRGLRIKEFKIHFFNSQLSQDERKEIYNTFNYCCRECDNDLSNYSNEELIKELNSRI